MLCSLLWPMYVRLCLYFLQDSLKFLNLSFSVSPQFEKCWQFSHWVLLLFCSIIFWNSYSKCTRFYVLGLFDGVLNVLFDTLCGTLDNFFQSIFQDTNFSPVVSNIPFNPPIEFLMLTITCFILETHLLHFQLCLVASNSLFFLSHISKLLLYLPTHIKYVIL